MPFDWVEPELFLEHRGIKIWHAYSAGDPQRQLSNVYTIAEWCDDSTMDEADTHQFDVTELPQLPGVSDHELIIRHAIDERRIPLPADSGISYHHTSNTAGEHMKSELTRMSDLKSRAERNGSGNKYRVAWCEDAKEYVIQVWTVDGEDEGWLCLHELEGEASNPEDYFDRTGKSYIDAD